MFEVVAALVAEIAGGVMAFCECGFYVCEEVGRSSSFGLRGFGLG